jgi:hypothetical protein
MSRKPNSNSKLDALGEAQKADLVRLLVDGCSYKEALEWLEAECLVKSGLSALSVFYNRHVVPLLKERREFAAMQAGALDKLAGQVDWDKASIEQLKALAFRELNREGADVEVIEKLTKLLLKNREQELSERRVKLMESNAQIAKDKLTKLASDNKGGLTAETLKLIEEAAGLL